MMDSGIFMASVGDVRVGPRESCVLKAYEAARFYRLPDTDPIVKRGKAMIDHLEAVAKKLHNHE